MSSAARTTLPAPRPGLDALVLFLLALALYLPVLGNGFTDWDDNRYVLASPVAALGWRGVLRALTHVYDGAYFPLTHSAYALLHSLFGPWPLPYHLVQWLLFASACALLPRALGAFGAPRGVSFWAGLLWLAHPLRVETVAWVSDLKDVLAALGLFSAFALHGAGRRRASLAAFLAALLAKATVFPLALLFLFLEWRRGQSRWTCLLWLLPAGAVAGISLLAHLGSGPKAFLGGSLAQAVPSALFLPWHYAGLVLLPRHPQAIYEFAPVSWSEPRFFAALALWGGWSFWLWRRRGARFPPLVSAAWLLPLLPVLGLVPLSFPLADRYSLFPSLALAVSLALGAEALARRGPALRIGVVAVLILAGSSLAALSRKRLPEWKSSLTLWEADRLRASGAWQVWFNLAGAYGGEGRWSEAISALEQARRLEPGRLEVLSALYFAQAAAGKLPFARIEAHLAAIDRSAKDPRLLLGVAAATLDEGQPEAAWVLASAVLEWNPSVEARLLMADIELARKRPEEALRQASLALEADPGLDTARLRQAAALTAMGRIEEALRAIEAAPSSEELAPALARMRTLILIRAGRVTEAEAPRK